MKCFENWRQLSIKQQLLGLYGTTVSISQIIVFCLLIAYIVVTTDKILEISKDNVKSLIIKNSNSLANDYAYLFVITMTKYASGFLFPYYNGAQNSFESGYNMKDIPGYLDYGQDYLARPLTYSKKYGQNISLVHSSFMTNHLFPHNVSNLNPSIIKIINKTMNADEFIKPAYGNYQDFFALAYMGYENGGLLMQYPGYSTLGSDPQRLYDPRITDWYALAKSSSTVVFSDPYADFYEGGGWMISILKSIYVNNQFVGVAGADMLINTLSKDVLKDKIFGTGKISLFTSDGIIVSDPEWNTSKYASHDTITYENLNNPKISSDMWKVISSTNNTLQESGDFYIISRKLQLFSQNFYIVLTIPKKVVTSSTEIIIDYVNNSKGKTLIITSMVLLAFSIFTTLITLYVANDLSNSIQGLIDGAKKVVSNLGKDDLSDGVVVNVENNENIEEINDVKRMYGNLVSTIKANGIKDELINPFFGKEEEILRLFKKNNFPDHL
jgi:hypothetical protein